MDILAYIVHLLQNPAIIPEGPAWAVAIALMIAAAVAFGNIVVKIIEAVNKRNHRTAEERSGTRRTDDVKVTRQEIEAELEQARYIEETHTEVGAVAEGVRGFHDLLERVTQTLEMAEKSRLLNTGLLDTAVQQLARLEALASKTDMVEEHRHTTRNIGVLLAGVEAKLGAKIDALGRA